MQHPLDKFEHQLHEHWAKGPQSLVEVARGMGLLADAFRVSTVSFDELHNALSQPHKTERIPFDLLVEYEQC